MKVIPLSEPSIAGNEWEYVKECLDSGWVSSAGSFVQKFEKSVSDYVGTKRAIAVVNGTSALHLSLLAAGVEENDEVIIPTLTFVATANVLRYCNAYPIFMDCETDTLCMHPEKTNEFLKKESRKGSDGFTYNKKTGRRIKGIIPVHVFGHPAEMDELMETCREYNLFMIEDATESLGSEYKGKKTGSFGKAGCFSFNGNKIITSGGGGMVVTDDEEFASKVRHLSTQAKSDHIEYEHDEVGYNYRLTNIQAAMGVAQMEQLDRFVEKKRSIANLYKDLLAEVEGCRFLWEHPSAKSNFWFNTICVPKEDKKPLLDFLFKNKIQARPVWKLIHTLPMYRGFQEYRLENIVKAYDTCLNLPSSVDLKEEEAEFVSSKIREYFR